MTSSQTRPKRIQRKRTREPLQLGSTVKPYGKIAAVACISGERYYFLIDKRGAVAMMPACSVEGIANA